MKEPFDFAVIGGGSAGYAGAAAASKIGLKTLIVEGGSEVGGLCILRGCMPSKTLLESGHRAAMIREAAEFGLKASYEGADGATILARKRRLIAEFADYRRGQLESGNFEFVRGRASFVDAQTIEIQLADGSSRRVNSRTFLVATGSTISIPNIPGLRETGFWTSDDVLDASEIPSSVCILGGGAIALELATYYHGLGIPTTVIQRSARILKEMDSDISDALTEALRERGLHLYTDTHLQAMDRSGNTKRVHFTHTGRSNIAEAEQLVCALGRHPATDSLGLERAGIPLTGGRILAESTQQCGSKFHFAAGDVCGPLEVVHLAIQQAEVAARNAARILGKFPGEDLERMDYAQKLFACFSQPEVAAVGLTEVEARTAGRDVVSAKYLFADHGKALIHGETAGFVKLIAERETKRLLGGACLGPHASELIHEISVALRFGATAGQLATTPHYHPTLSEIWTYPAEEIADS